MALASVSVCMALAGYRVLIIDWDLEAPGLEVFFKSAARLQGDPAEKPGIVDLLEAHQTGSSLRWQGCLLQAHFLGKSLDIISAGRRSPDYRKRVQKLDWATLYEEHKIGNFINQLRNEWCDKYDFILVDSRTGITDIGDVCTVLLPDVLVLLFVSNQQNIDGIKMVMERATTARAKLPVDRGKLLAIPLPGRDEIYNEYDKAAKWRDTYVKELGFLFSNWLPKEVSAADAFNKLFIPYVTNWSFGERIPVLESQRETQDPTTIGAAYQRVATLLANKLDWYGLEKRASVAEVQGARVELQRAREEAHVKQQEIDRLALDREQEKLERRAKRKSVLIWTLAIVVASVVTLASISIPAYRDYSTRAQVSEGANLAAAVKAGVAEYYATNNKAPASNEDVGLGKPTAINSKYVSAVSVEQLGTIRVLFGGDADEELQGKALQFKPWSSENGDLYFLCFSDDIDDKMLPAQCRSTTQRPAGLKPLP
jgi:Tfp pilus assembly protein PilE/cellulose biosynthesis protein BcsQ